MFRSAFLFIISALIFVVFGCKPEKKAFYDIAILNGNVIDLETGKFSQQDVFIAEGRIKKMLPTASGTAIDAVESVDATGKYLLPGFWDNHVHFRGGDSLIEANKNFLKIFMANGITTVRDAGGDLTPSVMQWKDEISNGVLIGPTIFTSGPKIDGTDATWAGSLEVVDADGVAKALDSLQKIPVDFVKLYDSRISGELYLKTIAEAEKRKLITAGHMPFTVTLEKTIGAGIDAIEHLYYIMKGCSNREKEITQKLVDKEIGFWEAMPLLQESYSDTTAKRTFQSLKSNNVFVVPTLHIGKTLSYLDEIDHSSDTYLDYMGQGIIKTYDGRINRAKKSSPEAVQNRKDLDVFFGRLTKSLHDAGVSLLAGSDSGAFNSYTYPGISLHKELEALVAKGISPIEALRTSAFNGARFLKQNADYGNIEVGKIADLVLLDANPLEDITNTQKINAVVKRNQVMTKIRLKELLKEAIIK